MDVGVSLGGGGPVSYDMPVASQAIPIRQNHPPHSPWKWWFQPIVLLSLLTPTQQTRGGRGGDGRVIGRVDGGDCGAPDPGWPPPPSAAPSDSIASSSWWSGTKSEGGPSQLWHASGIASHSTPTKPPPPLSLEPSPPRPEKIPRLSKSRLPSPSDENGGSGRLCL